MQVSANNKKMVGFNGYPQGKNNGPSRNKIYGQDGIASRRDFLV
jgi:hypothetical protein